VPHRRSANLKSTTSTLPALLESYKPSLASQAILAFGVQTIAMIHLSNQFRNSGVRYGIFER
jgi:hypothetical protein